jgi:hypothetical protein
VIRITDSAAETTDTPPMILLAALLLADSAALEATQIAYLRCLGAEADAARRNGIAADVFAEGAPHVCEQETAAYRAVVLATLASDRAAPDRFDTMDAANRRQMIDGYGGRRVTRRLVSPGFRPE